MRGREEAGRGRRVGIKRQQEVVQGDGVKLKKFNVKKQDVGSKTDRDDLVLLTLNAVSCWSAT